MKQLLDKTLITLSLFLLVGCTTSTKVNPSQNDALNEVSNSTAKKENSYFLQQQFDGFINDELAPSVAKDKEIQDKYMDKHIDKKTGEVTYVDREDDNFTLQEIADKLGSYKKATEKDDSNSHVKKVESLPVLGSSRKR